MPDLKNPLSQSDFSSNKGVLPWENKQLKTGAQDSIGRQTNDLKPFSTSAKVSGPFGGEAKPVS